MTIAAIAYRELSMKDKTRVSELLHHHPEYSKWASDYSTNSAVDLAAFVFIRASTWPDEIRRKGNAFDHPQWHYINYPLIAPAFPDLPGPSPTNDIVYGVGSCEKALSNPKLEPEYRATSLSWLIHLVGDIHQPLHCVALINADYPAPQGDKGGNDFFVRPNSVGVNLHSVWDKALGSSGNPRAQWNDAIQVATTYPRKSLSELSRYKTPTTWSKESRAMALAGGYLNGDLKGSAKAVDAPPLPDGYTKNLKAIAERQAAVAGYRLADEIKKHLR